METKTFKQIDGASLPACSDRPALSAGGDVEAGRGSFFANSRDGGPEVSSHLAPAHGGLNHVDVSELKDLFRPSDRRQPQYDLNDPRHPVNAGWRRSDLPEGHRRVRFRVTMPDVPKVAPPPADLTNREFMGGLR